LHKNSRIKANNDLISASLMAEKICHIFYQPFSEETF
jgi:hypothetical protein